MKIRLLIAAAAICLGVCLFIAAARADGPPGPRSQCCFGEDLFGEEACFVVYCGDPRKGCCPQGSSPSYCCSEVAASRVLASIQRRLTLQGALALAQDTNK